jgi:hypothetical protein
MRPLHDHKENHAMSVLQKIILIGALLISAAPSLAEEAHHSDSPATEAPPAAASQMPGEQAGMMGSDMMSGGMMGSGMMSMMGPMARMMAPEHIEGRIAFLETELKITDAQGPLWSAFADALRANARDTTELMTEMQGTMAPSQGTGPATLLQRIDLQEHMLAIHLHGVRQIKAALQPLYGALDDTQKRAADELLMPGPMGSM